MRLLYVCSDWGIAPDGSKGAAVHLRAITKAFAELGHEVQLLAPKGAPSNGHPATAVLHESCHLAEDTARLLRHWLEERELPPGIGREVRPLIFNAWAFDRAMHELRDHPPTAIVERLSLFGHLGLDLARALDVPLLLEVNAPLTREASDFRALQLQNLATEIEQRVLRGADRIAAVSRPLRDLLVSQGTEASRIDVVPNGVDPRSFEGLPSRDSLRARHGLGNGFVVGFAGSLKPWHGVHVLIEAFAMLSASDSEARLLLVGTGPTALALQADVTQRGLQDRVVFTGAVPHEEVPALLSAMDVAVAPFLPVEDFYFSPIKVFEYMGSGACVLASRLGQLTELVEDGVDGLLFEAGNAADLAEQLKLARCSPSMRASLADRARAKVFSRYTWSRAAEAMRGSIEKALGDRVRGTPLVAEARSSRRVEVLGR